MSIRLVGDIQDSTSNGKAVVGVGAEEEREEWEMHVSLRFNTLSSYVPKMLFVQKVQIPTYLTSHL